LGIRSPCKISAKALLTLDTRERTTLPYWHGCTPLIVDSCNPAGLVGSCEASSSCELFFVGCRHASRRQPGLLGVSLAFTPSAHAQVAAAGAILGTITDPTGAVIPDAEVTISNAATQQSRTTQSNPQGFYDFESLLAAHYEITIKYACTQRHTQLASTGSPRSANSSDTCS
jgi:hypothetical protein